MTFIFGFRPLLFSKGIVDMHMSYQEWLGFRPLLFNKGIVEESSNFNQRNRFRPLLFNKGIVANSLSIKLTTVLDPCYLTKVL